MKSSRTTFLLAAAALILVGILSIFLQPGPPETECAPDDMATSGYVDDESGCPITTESFNEVREYETSPKLFRLAGLGLIVVGIGVGIFGLTRKKRTDGPAPTT